jgi:hypothetical protein
MPKIQVCDGTGKDHFPKRPDRISANVFSCLNWGPDGFAAQILLDDAGLLLDDLHNVEHPSRDVRIIINHMPFTATAALLVGHEEDDVNGWLTHADISVSKVIPR